MNAQEAEQYLTTLNNMPRQKYPRTSKRGAVYLKRLHYFLDLLGNPEKRIPHYVHVTGTSGKGSVATFMASVLSTSGKKTGLMISPHPTHMRERWQVSGTIMTEREFIKIIETLRPVLDTYSRTSPYDMVSYLDIITAIGLFYFAKKKVTWAVLEAGCGGRYDSTNIIPHKDVAIITSVGLDHMHLLGNTKEKIAYEKIGIVTSACHVFTMERNPKVLKVIKKECQKKNIIPHLSPLSLAPTVRSYGSTGVDFSYENHEYHLPIMGDHQIKNAAMVIDIAHQLGINDQTIRHGLATAVQALRLEVAGYAPIVIFDGAHNPDKMKTTVRAIQLLSRSPEFFAKTKKRSRLHLIIGFANDKKVSPMIKRLAKLLPTTVACTRNTVNPFRKVAAPTALVRSCTELLPHASIAGFLDPEDALTWSLKQCGPRDILLVTGSIFLSGQVKALFQAKILDNRHIFD